MFAAALCLGLPSSPNHTGLQLALAYSRTKASSRTKFVGAWERHERPGPRIFHEHGTRGLKSRRDPEERELTLARARIGELMMRLALAEHLIEKRGFTDEGKKHQR